MAIVLICLLHAGLRENLRDAPRSRQIQRFQAVRKETPPVKAGPEYISSEDEAGGIATKREGHLVPPAPLPAVY